MKVVRPQRTFLIALVKRRVNTHGKEGIGDVAL